MYTSRNILKKVVMLSISLILIIWLEFPAHAHISDNNTDKATLLIQQGLAVKNVQVHNIILEDTYSADNIITPSIIIDTYGKEIAWIIFATIVLLIGGVFYIARVNTELKIQNKRYKILSEISNEYIYEYNVKKDVLIMSEKSAELLGTEGFIESYSSVLKNSLVSADEENIPEAMNLKPLLEKTDKIYEISLPLANGEVGYFKVINTILYGSNRKVEYIIGKLIDISEEKAENQALLKKAQRDGMTGLYNAETSKDFIINMLSNKEIGDQDAFILLDVDYFKEINDSLGHYTGNQVLQDLAKFLKKTFRSTDVVGRLGGDEFCVYLQNVTSAKFVQVKCQLLKELVSTTYEGITVSLSIGIVMINEKKTYKEMFQQADYALYEAKRNGRNQVAIYNYDKGNF